MSTNKTDLKLGKGIVPQAPRNDWGKHRQNAKASTLHIVFSSKDKQHGTCRQYINPGKSFYRHDLRLSETGSSTPVKMDTQPDNLKSSSPHPASPHQSKKVINTELLFSPQGHHLKLGCKISTPTQGTEMGCGRFVRTTVTKGNASPEEGVLLSLSPNKPYDRDRKKAKRKLHLPDSETFSLPAAAQSQNTAQNSVPIKGGQEVEVRPSKRQRKDYLTQYEVMGCSAKEEMQKAIDSLESKNNAELEKFISEQAKTQQIDPKELSEKLHARLTNLVKSCIHWMHGEGFKLYRRNKNPQVPENLGAGPDYINYWQYVFEQCVIYFTSKEFTKKFPGVQVFIKPTFFMLPGTHVVSEIKYEFCVKTADTEVKIQSSVSTLNPSDRSNTASWSDAAQLIAVITAILEGREPRQETTLKLKP